MTRGFFVSKAMTPFKNPVAVTIAAGAVVNLVSEAITALNANVVGIQAVQIDLPRTFTGSLHVWPQIGSRSDSVNVGDVRKMTENKYVPNNPLQYAVGEQTDLLVATDSGTGSSIEVMVTLWV